MTMHFTNQNSSLSPMFFIHSSASNGGQWDAFVEAFGNEREVFAPNLAGYGPVYGEIDQSLSGIAELASPLIAEIEMQHRPVHLVGHSFGGAVALHIALERPELVESLAIYEPASFHILRSGTVTQRQAFEEINGLAQSLEASIADGNPAQGMQRFIDFWNGAGCWNSFSERKRTVMAGLARTVLSNFEAGRQEKWSLADLNNLQIPTLLMEGGQSPAVSRRVTAAIGSSIPGAMIATYDMLGHMAPAFCPEKLFPVIRDHISFADNLVIDQVWPLQSAA